MVEDHGEGIPEADKERVTLPFVRLDPARGGNAHSGLGLAIVDRLVRQAGGKLNLVNAHGGGFRVEMLFGGATAA
ncbi:transcriptional regulator of glycopeptide resistance proteins [compost metagenome]